MKEQISGIQFITLMIWLILGTGVLTLPSSINQFARFQDGWIVTALMYIVPLILAVFGRIYFQINGNRDFWRVLEQTFGHTIGIALSSWIGIWLYICTCTIVREFGIFIEINFLPRTPICVTAALILLPTSYCIYNGIETLSRMSLLVSFSVCIGLIINCIFMATKWHSLYFLPLLTKGWQPVIEASIYPWAFTSELIIALFLLPSLKTPKKIAKYLIISGSIISSFAMLIEVLSISVLGRVGMFAVYPLLKAIREISIGIFLQRLEPLYVVLVIGSVFIKLTLFQQVFTNSVQTIVRIEDKRDIIWSLGLAVWAGSSFFFQNDMDLNNFILFTFPFYTFSISLFIPMLLLATQLMFKRK